MKVLRTQSPTGRSHSNDNNDRLVAIISPLRSTT